MPNHVTNIITINAKPERVKEILCAIQEDEAGVGSIDFNKLRPMPKSIEDVEVSSDTDKIIELYLTYINPMVDYFGPKINLESVDSITHFHEYTVSGDEFVRIYKGFNDDKNFNRYNAALPPQKVKESVDALLRYESQGMKSVEDIAARGKSLYQNIREHGSMSWYTWAVKQWGTKWNAYTFGGYADGNNTITFETAWSAPHPILKLLSEKFRNAEFNHSWADEDIGANVGNRVYKDGDIVDENIPNNHSVEAYEMAADIKGDSLEARGLYKTADGQSYEYREEEEYEELEV